MCWRHERRLGTKPNARRLRRMNQTGGRRGGRYWGGQDQSLQNVGWTTARLVTPVTGHRLQLRKQLFVPYLLKPSKQDNYDNKEEYIDDEEDDDDDETRFVIKRQNTLMCFSTKKLEFLGIINYLAPSVSYDKYLKAYGCELQKGHFPYEYMNCIGKLEDRALPPQETFYSRPKNEYNPTMTTLAVGQCGVTIV